MAFHFYKERAIEGDSFLNCQAEKNKEKR